MFDLERHLSQWRAHYQAGAAYNADDVDELETHLRDEMDQLEAKGLLPEESFWIARRRLGEADVLEGEYGKNKGAAGWRKPLLWALGGYVSVQFFTQALALVSGLTYALSAFFPAAADSPLSSLSVWLLAPLEAVFRWRPDPAFSPYLVFNILWQTLLMGAIAALAFYPRLRQKFNLRFLRGIAPRPSRRALLLSGMLALSLFLLGKMGIGGVVYTNLLEPSQVGIIAGVNMYLGLVWTGLFVLVFLGLLFQSTRHARE